MLGKLGHISHASRSPLEPAMVTLTVLPQEGAGEPRLDDGALLFWGLSPCIWVLPGICFLAVSTQDTGRWDRPAPSASELHPRRPCPPRALQAHWRCSRSSVAFLPTSCYCPHLASLLFFPQTRCRSWRRPRCRPVHLEHRLKQRLPGFSTAESLSPPSADCPVF